MCECACAWDCLRLLCVLELHSLLKFHVYHQMTQYYYTIMIILCYKLPEVNVICLITETSMTIGMRGGGGGGGGAEGGGISPVSLYISLINTPLLLSYNVTLIVRATYYYGL